MRTRPREQARTLRGVAVMLAALAVAIAFSMATPQGAKSRTLACVAFAQQPAVYNHQARAGGGFTDPCTSSSWYYDMFLKNNANNTLAEDTGTGYYGSDYVGSWAGCSGATVHTFIWINNNGSITSDSGPTDSTCSY